MPKKILTQDRQKTVKYIREDNSGKVIVEREFHDQHGVTEKNKRARLDGVLKTGDDASAIHEGSEVVYHFQIPNGAIWAAFKRKHKQLCRNLLSRDHITREAAAAKLKALRPEWVVAAPGKHFW